MREQARIIAGAQAVMMRALAHFHRLRERERVKNREVRFHPDQDGMATLSVYELG